MFLLIKDFFFMEMKVEEDLVVLLSYDSYKCVLVFYSFSCFVWQYIMSVRERIMKIFIVIKFKREYYEFK